MSPHSPKADCPTLSLGINPLLSVACLPGAERLQEAEPVCAFGGTHPGGLCHQPHLHLGGPAGPERVPADGAAAPPEQLPPQGQREEEPPPAPARGR